eukprot:gene396-255_t
MADTGLVDSVGLSMATLFPSLGKTAADNFGKILDILSKKTPANAATLASVVDGVKLWCITCQLPAKVTLLKEHQARLFDIIASLAVAADDTKTGDYKGDVYVASVLAESLDNAAKMDISQEMSAQFAPSAYNAAERILKSATATFEVKAPMRNDDTIGTRRGENGPTFIELMRLGGNDDLATIFTSGDNDVYFNNPEAVNNNLDLFLKPDSFMSYGFLFTSVASRYPEVLVSHVDFFIQAISSASAGPWALTVLANMAEKCATKFTNEQVNEIITKGRNVFKGEHMLARIVGRLATVPGAAETCFALLLNVLDMTTEVDGIPSIYSELSNAMVLLPSRDILLKNMDRLSAKKSYAGVLFKEIEDYANGRSLAGVTLRLDVLDAKVNALNTKVSETCTNMADVLAYVDANMADMKDFLAQVTKRLPQPKRLEVVGTLRKTLILHFECCRTGLEFPVTSHDWSKWLKMGFSLVKAGQAVIDLGMGNPLGILKKGVECVQEIYQAYKTNDDDEFNTYITNPFLLSHEQDQLLEKLRDQGFFDIFAYDAQVAGWYLVNPEKDGRAPEGEAGSVSKVWTKKGYGITEGLVAAASGALEMDLSPIADAVSSIGAGKSEEDKGVELGTVATSASSNAGSNAASSGVVGGRAAAMREQFGTEANRSANEKLGNANVTAQYQQKVDALQDRVVELEKKVAAMSTSLAEVRNRPAGCNCVIC